ncbi:efflux RND transporter permease subunit, partial [bacterium]|nr:efflux RND transporter permease subunit [bacterium]
MLNAIVEKVLNRPYTTILFFLTFAAAGVFLIPLIPIDATPDITNVQVMVNTITGGLDPEQIEKSVTTPVETEMGGIAGVKEVRSLSKNGLSQVVVVFEDGTDIYWARQQISERLQAIRGNLPEGISPELGPISTGLGEVLMYVVLAKPESELAKKAEIDRLLYLRTVQDFAIRRYLKANCANIADVDATGGFKKEIHVNVDPVRLEDRGLGIEDIVRKLETVGESFGGGYIQHEGRQVIVRTAGTLNLDRIRRIAVKLDLRGHPVFLSEVADVREGFVQRQGAATYDGEETVLGIILMRSGANSRRVSIDAEKALAEIPLPSDVEVKILYSRRYLVEATIHTVAKNLAEGAVLVVLVLLLILGNFRAALLVSLAIPLSMLFAAAGMKYFGISANLMSLGAIDFGLLVDASVVIIENVLRRISQKSGEPEGTANDRLNLVLDAVKEVLLPVTIGLVLIMAVYIPILALEGVEGKLFKPMAMTVLMALASSLAVAVGLMPALAYLVLRVPRGEHKETALFALAQNMYRPLLKFSLGHRAVLFIAVSVLSGASLFVFSRMGADFMPPLNEGDLVVNLTRDSGIALDESMRVQKISDRIIAKFAEVEHVYSRTGTPESATDPMGVHLSDVFVIPHKNEKLWPVQANGRRRTKDELFEAIREAIDREAPGHPPSNGPSGTAPGTMPSMASQEIMANQPIEMRFSEILEGTRADVSLRIYGPELETLMELLETSKQTVETIRGASEVELDGLT